MKLRRFSIRRASRRMPPEELTPLPEDVGRRFRLSVESERRGEGRWYHRMRHEALSVADAGSSAVYFAELDLPRPIAPLEVLDPFVMMLAFRQMTFGGVLEVAGPVSRTLIRNLAMVQALSHNRWPLEYRPFAVAAERVVERAYARAPRPAGLLSFTGGLDSTLTLYRATDPAHADLGYPVDLAVTVVGYNPHGDRLAADYEARHMDHVRRVCGRRGLDAGLVRTDLWKIPSYIVKPHGAVLGGLFALAAPAFSFAVIGSSTASGDTWLDRGCSPEWQASYGTGGFDTPTSLSLFTRPERVQLLAAYGGEACDELIVCGTAENLPANCGRCAKCVRTMLTFEAAGLPIPRCFPAEIDLGLVGYGASKQPEIGYYQEIVDLADALGTDTPALRVMRRRYLKKVLKRQLVDFLFH
jgi:hypothetical protein